MGIDTIFRQNMKWRQNEMKWPKIGIGPQGLAVKNPVCIFSLDKQENSTFIAFFSPKKFEKSSHQE